MGQADVANADTDLDGHADVDDWFRALYPSLRRFGSVVAPPDVDPDDLVQEALVGFLRRQAHGPVDDPRAYLHRSIMNAASNRRRSFQRRVALASRLGAVDEQSTQAYPSDLTDLLRLPPRERGALYLHVVEGLPHRDVGELLGCSEAAARKAMARGVSRLGLELSEVER